MKYLWFICSAVSIIGLSSCSTGSSGGSGELVGVKGRKSFKQQIPYGMVYIPGGSFLMGQSDQDITASGTAQNRQFSIRPFYMDETEISNNEYRQFVYWVRDSIAAKQLGGEYLIQGDNGTETINPKKQVKWDGKNSDIDKLGPMFYQGDDEIPGKKELDVSKLVYEYSWFDINAAARTNVKEKKQSRSTFIKKEKIGVYPDTLVWLKDFTYAQNEPMVEQYFSHSAFDNYPVVGVTWTQAKGFAHWRTKISNDASDRAGRPHRGSFDLPTEAEFEFAARGGRIGTEYPWGGPYIRNSKGCLLANFKPGRGSYADDGGFYTVDVKSYFPNDYGLYNMAGNVSEWTNSAYDESSYSFVHDMNPTFSGNYEDNSLASTRKVIRGGSWKDIGYFLQNGVRSYEYKDTATSYIGFRCVATHLGRIKTN